MAIFIKHVSCNRCGSSDARAIYSDGSEWCFSCGHGSGRSASQFTPSFEDEEEDCVVLPKDLSHEFTQEIVDWLKPTEVLIDELIRHQFFYSRSEHGLVRLLTNLNANEMAGGLRPRTCAFEVRRVFGTVPKSVWQKSKGPKTLFRGNKETASGLVQPLPGQCREQHSLCIVEDSISAVKIGRGMDCIPLFGSTISNNKLATACKSHNRIYVWLDSDKLNSARSIVERVGYLGRIGRVIYTELDPKYLNVDVIWDI